MATERNLGCVVVAVDESEESMNALKWSLENLRLRPASADGEQPAGTFTVLHVQPAPSIVSGISPAAIPFGGPSKLYIRRRAILFLCFATKIWGISLIL